MRRVLKPYRAWPDPVPGSRLASWLEALEGNEAVKATMSGDELYLDSYERYAGEWIFSFNKILSFPSLPSSSPRKPPPFSFRSSVLPSLSKTPPLSQKTAQTQANSPTQSTQADLFLDFPPIFDFSIFGFGCGFGFGFGCSQQLNLTLSATYIVMLEKSLNQLNIIPRK